ncbi:hypothetical protein [Nonomuraea guangzhouensis]|uniref:AAA+ ATPase domain-containing protein n=1 Tax=Nonomuraea guangzhouensis TaxID=1291555 RepID=A0ABW4GWV0_9ACTN|nr:hypothetical protein [Nonomuraea guangzhouensis]
MESDAGGPIVVLTALDSDHAMLRSRMIGARTEVHGGIQFDMGRLGLSIVALALLELEEFPTVAITERARLVLNPRMVLFLGSGRALSSDVAPGDVVVADEIRRAEGEEAASPELLRTVTQSLAGIRIPGKIHIGPVLISDNACYVDNPAGVLAAGKAARISACLTIWTVGEEAGSAAVPIVMALTGALPSQAVAPSPGVAWQFNHAEQDGVINVVNGPMEMTHFGDQGAAMYAVANGWMVVNHTVQPDLRTLFQEWERSLRRTTVQELSTRPSLHLERTLLLSELMRAFGNTGPGRILLIRGEPGSGKSVAALKAAEEFRRREGGLLVARMRDVAAHAELLSGAQGELLVLDGAEAIQTGLDPDAVHTALEAGARVVLISRDDAAQNIREMFSCTVEDFVVPPLDDKEIETILASAPELAVMAEDMRSRWLLRRLGLVNLLLRAARRGAVLPDALACESDVYKVYHSAVVLNLGMAVNGVPPDDRAAALGTIAERMLGKPWTPTLSGAALASLRSDGILTSIGDGSAIGEETFAHDILRDFATAWRLFQEGGTDLLEIKGPRWAIRAARILCQERIRPGTGLRPRWAQMYDDFRRLASVHGSRWEEIPWEAVLSTGWSAEVLDALSERLLSEPSLLEQLLRCTMLRFGEDAACDPVTGGPVVAWLARHGDVLTRRHDDLRDDVVLAWLRGVSRLETRGDNVDHHRPTRVLLRDSLVASPPQYDKALFLEALALLGGDQDERSETLLRAQTSGRAYELIRAVDRFDPASSLAVANPALLVELALAYYRPGRGRSRHEFGLASRAAWHRGPFIHLLLRSPKLGFTLIRGLLESFAEGPALAGDFMSLGEREYPGPAASWSWYQGALNGPQPCMSGLMAVERVLLDEFALPPKDAAVITLREIGTVAGAGLAYSMLLRQLDEITNELDSFLALPEVWELEFARFAARRLHKLEEPQSLELAPTEVAMRLVVQAMSQGDEAALERLRQVGRQLLAAGDGDDLAVHNWADHFDAKRYVLARSEQGWIAEVKSSAEADLARARAGTALNSRLYRMLNNYRPLADLPYRIDPPAKVDPRQLTEDLETVRSLDLSVSPLGARCSVAAATIHAVAAGALLDADDLGWSIDLLLTAIHPSTDVYPDAISAWGDDIQAAFALPRTLLPAFAESRQADPEAIIACAAHPVHQVRTYFAEGLRPLWSEPCAMPCHHLLAWRAVETGIRHALDGFDSTRHRTVIERLDRLHGAEQILRELETSVTPVLDAASARHCVTETARRHRTALLAAYARSAESDREEDKGPMAAALLRTARNEPEVVLEFVEHLASRPNVLDDLLWGFKTVATYETGLTDAFASLWPTIMEIILTRPGEDAPASASLLPNPQPWAMDADIDGTIRETGQRWLRLAPVEHLIDAWTLTAPTAGLDELLGFLRVQPIYQQVEIGLPWVARLVRQNIKLPGYLLLDWLRDIHPELTAVAHPHFQTIVDALAEAGHTAAIALQQLEE